MDRDEQLKWHHNMHVKFNHDLSVQLGFDNKSALSFFAQHLLYQIAYEHIPPNSLILPSLLHPDILNLFLLWTSLIPWSLPPSNLNNLCSLSPNVHIILFTKLFYWSLSLAFSPRPLSTINLSLSPPFQPVYIAHIKQPSFPFFLCFFCPSHAYLQVSFCIIDDPFSLRYAKSYIHLIFSTLLIFS